MRDTSYGTHLWLMVSMAVQRLFRLSHPIVEKLYGVEHLNQVLQYHKNGVQGRFWADTWWDCLI